MSTPTEPISGTGTTSINVPAPTPPARTFTEDDLARARQQEKDKLYKELEQLREQVGQFGSVQTELEALRKEREEREAREQAAREAAAQAAREKEEAELSAKELLAKRTSEMESQWEQKLLQLQKEREVERAALEKEREFAALRDFIQTRMQEEGGNIAPELHDLVGGNTPEEVNASIERLKAKSAAIAEKVRGSQQQFAAQQRGVSPAGFNATGPMDMLPTTQNYSAEDIAQMSMKEYAEKIRGQFIGRGDAARNRGLFG